MTSDGAVGADALTAPGTGPRFKLGIYGALKLSENAAYKLELDFLIGAGPTQLTFGPQQGQAHLGLRDLVNGLAAMLDLSAQVAPFTSLSASWPWKTIFDVYIDPYLTVEVSGQPSVQFVLDLYSSSDAKPPGGIDLPGPNVPSWLTIEPDFTVYSLIVGYDKSKGGLDLRAKVAFKEQPKMLERQRARALIVGEAEPPPGKKTEIVSYPFPNPAPSSPNFQVKYLGLGQRFGPTVDITKDDPLAAMFDDLEANFTTNDPAKLLPLLATYYHPDRDWFIAADVILRGWEVRAVFNDPSLYGLEITCDVDQFKGLLIEILYQKLGNGLGVYYGALTLPQQYRTIQLGAAALTLPSFKIWVYTNGDFKVCVGWPLGPNSIGLQVYIFTGGGGFYFAKLRSGDNPEKGSKALMERGSVALADTVTYNPIIEFGLGVWLGVGRSFSSGPFSASISLTVQGTFQGILAWAAPPDDPNKAQSLSRPPDYMWFAATLGIVGQVQGDVDLKIVKLSVLIELSVIAGLALETDYGTTLNVTANVHVEASLKILFITIRVGFSATISQTFQLSSGPKGEASIEGPKNPAFHGMNDWAATGLDALEERLLEVAAARRRVAASAARVPLPPAPLTPQPVTLGFLLQPAAVYANGKGTPCAVATLTIESPAAAEIEADDDDQTELEKLADAFAVWLLRTWSADGTWRSVLAKIGSGRAPDPPDWATKLGGFLADDVIFTIQAIDLTSNTEDGAGVALFPMFENLDMSWDGRKQSVSFADHQRTYPNYVSVVDEYFAQLSLNGLTPNPPDLRTGIEASDDGPPTGPSLASYVFDDYFLTLARHLAGMLAAPDDQGGMPTTAQVADLGGLTSRYLLNGLRLPDPATTPPQGPIDPSKLEIEPGYALTGQQFAVDPSLTTAQAVLQLGDETGGPAIEFAPKGATSVTSTMPVSAVPAAPAPVWVDTGPTESADLDGATITVGPIAPARLRTQSVAARTRLPWQQPGGQTPFVVPLPPEVLAASRKDPLTLTVTAPDSNDPLKPLSIQPVLLIPIRVHLVDRPRESDVVVADSLAHVAGDGGGPAAAANSPYVPFVYRIDGTDDETRERIEAALDGRALAPDTMTLLYNAATTGYQSDAIDLSKHPVMLAKTNLSTTSQPGSLATPMRLAQYIRALDDTLGPTSAPLDAAHAADFLRLVWEESIVRSGGFFLRYETADDQQLPARIFSADGKVPADGVPNGDTADVTIALTFPAGQQFQSWHNAFLVTLTPDVKGTLLIEMADSSGPLQQLQPAIPPGCAGFTAEWGDNIQALADTEADVELYGDDWVSQLYHLIQFQVSGQKAGSSPDFGESLWSLALSPSQQGGTGPQTYRQVVPVYRFATGVDATNPYSAVGGDPQLTMRLNDIFGNALDSATDDVDLPVSYNDPLLTPAEWPGARVAYSFLPPDPSATSPTLTLDFEFDPKPIVGMDGHSAKAQARAALLTYAAVAGQLADSGTTLELRTSVLASNDGIVGDGAAIKAQLLAFVLAVQAQLQQFVDSETAPQPQSLSLPETITPTDLVNLTDDLFHIVVTLGLSRPPSLVYKDQNGETVPKSVAATATIAANLDPPAAGTALAQERAALTGDSPPVDIGLETFATNFETVFANFDGAGGSARVAVRSDLGDLSAPADTPFLWGLRMSGKAGFDLSFRESQAAYFSLAPISVNLEGGDALVPTYDQHLQPTYAKQTFSGVDIDAWAQAFLQAVDELLSPDVGTAISAIDSDTYANLMLAKSVLAQALAKGVVPVFDATGHGVVDGDLTSAQDLCEQSALGTLASAYTVAATVQVPVDVSVTGGSEALTPRLFGAVGVPGQGGNSKPVATSVSSAKVPLATTTQNAPAYLGFLVSVAEPTKEANVSLDLEWRARFAEHMAGPVEEDGYQPSEWLRVARQLPQDPLTYPLGTFNVPVPLRAYPDAPILQQQSATQTKPASIAETDPLAKYLHWDYGVELQLQALAAQDDLWVEVTYNLPVTDPGVRGLEEDDEPTLFQALASFGVAWPTLRPYAVALPGPAGDVSPPADGPTPAQTLDAVWEQVKAVTRAWARLRGIPDPWSTGDEPLADAIEAGGPATVVDRYVLNFQHADDDHVIQVFAQAPTSVGGKCDPTALIWPTINEQSPQDGTIAATCTPPESSCAAAPGPGGCWYSATYSYTPPSGSDPADLKFSWVGIDVLARQTARAACWRTRNADLSGDVAIPTNPAFVYQTPEVSFGSAIVPSIVVDHVGPLAPDPKSLSLTLQKALAAIAQAGTAAATTRLVKVAMSYEYALATSPDRESSVPAETAILLADATELLPDSVEAANGGVTLAQLCDSLAANTQVWFEYYAPRTDGAAVDVALVVFADVAGARLPVIDIKALELGVPSGWWPAS